MAYSAETIAIIIAFKEAKQSYKVIIKMIGKVLGVKINKSTINRIYNRHHGSEDRYLVSYFRKIADTVHIIDEQTK